MPTQSPLALIADYWHLLTSLHLRAVVILGGIVLAYALVHLSLRLADRKKAIPAGLIRAVRWFFVLILIYAAERLVLSTLDDRLVDTPLFVAKTLAWWLCIKNVLDGVYADLYLTRIKKRAVNHYVIDLIKFIVLLVLAAGALTGFFHIEVSSVLTSSAILTAVIGFSMQDTIGSIFSGFLLQIEKPFDVGDWIKVDELTGRVLEINWRYTTIETAKNDAIHIPNNAICKKDLVNYNRPIPEVCVELTIPVPFGVPPVRVKTLLAEVLAACPLVTLNPGPVIRFRHIEESRLIYKIFFYVRKYEEQFRAIDELHASVWYAFKAQGIELPLPGREVRLTRVRTAEPDLAPTEHLAALPLFAGLTEPALALITRIAAPVVFEPGRVIVKAGATSTSLFVVVSGRVAVRRGEAVLAEIGPGGVFGEMALLTGEPRKADVVALEPCQCLEIDREAFRLVLGRHPQISENVNAVFRERVAKNQPDLPREEQNHAELSLLALFRKIFG